MEVVSVMCGDGMSVMCGGGVSVMCGGGGCDDV